MRKLVITLVVIAAFVAFVFGYDAWRDRVHSRRVVALTAVASQVGMKVLGQNLSIKNPELLKAPLFTEGEEPSRLVSFAMEGTASGLYGLIGDYQYDYESRDSEGTTTHTNSQTFAAYENPRYQLPAFELQEHTTMNYLSMTGTDHDNLVSFEATPEFAKRFYLSAADKDQTRRVFTPDVRAFLLTISPSQKWHIQSSGPWLVFYVADTYAKPENFRRFVDDTSRSAATFFEKCACAAASAGGA